MEEKINPLHIISQKLYDECMSNASVKVALDIGANDGGYTNTLLEHGFQVHCFEPVPEIFEFLSQRYSENKNVILNNLALSDVKGELKNITVLESWTLGNPDNISLSVQPARVGVPYFDCKIDTLDNYIQENNLQIGIIKLDVDGYELKVLKGGRETILKQRPQILCELSLYIEKVGDSIEEFINYIFGLGYKIVSMDGEFTCHTWEEVKPFYPYNSSFDVMLIPCEISA